jgi:hypothetical protein
MMEKWNLIRNHYLFLKAYVSGYASPLSSSAYGQVNRKHIVEKFVNHDFFMIQYKFIFRKLRIYRLSKPRYIWMLKYDIFITKMSGFYIKKNTVKV